MPSYSRLDKILHAVALGSEAVKRASFDIERSLARADVAAVACERHVLITGLARAGTSILLRILHSSGAFATQTYRDMPFVLAPQLWQRIGGRHRLAGEEVERAHKDGLQVSFDSVEAFEEVFWLTFAGKRYVRADRLIAHAVDDELAAEFRDFVANVIAAQADAGARRYLSKNNNNVLRLNGLAKALPAAHIVVPFREPYQHARSLMRQHQQFTASQAADPFARRYMSWLGHFEFGLDYRPFAFKDDAGLLSAFDAERVEHWLESWTRVYRHVLDTAPANLVLWDYDAFCAAPRATLARLAARLGLELAPDTADGIRAPRTHEMSDAPDRAILRAARATHEELKARATAALDGASLPSLANAS